MTPLKTIFGCDLRTLALFRVGLGAALLVDLLFRARDFRAHYTAFGVIPLATGQEAFLYAGLRSLFANPWIQGGLFVAAGLAALALIVGFQTRVATLLGWSLLFLIQFQNRLILQSGDQLLLLLLFWSLFLPLGARFSIDAALAEDSEKSSSKQFFSIGTVAILLQMASFYFFSALLKNSPEWIPEGTAIYYALQLDSFIQPFGMWLRDFPGLMHGLTYYTWIIELVGPLLIFSPWFFPFVRFSMLAGLGFLHVGIVASMNVGLFPLFNFVSLLLFLPSSVWDRLTSSLNTPERKGLLIFYDGDCGFCRKICLLFKTFLVLPDARIAPAQEQPAVFDLMERDNTWVVRDYRGQQYTEWKAVVYLIQLSPIFWPLAVFLNGPPFLSVGTKLYRIIARNRGKLSQLTNFMLPYQQRDLQLSPVLECMVGGLAMYMVFINVVALPSFPISDPFMVVQKTLGLSQPWGMFAPHPRKWDGWYVISGQQIDGDVVDVFNVRSQRPSIEDSSFQESPYSTYRWRKYLQRIGREEYVEHRKFYGAYLCRLWNESHNPLQHLLFLKVYLFQVNTPPPGEAHLAKERHLIWEQPCI